MAPLHLTLGATQMLLRLGIDAIHLDSGPEAALEAVLAVGAALLEKIRVHLVSYHGGGFEGSACHRIRERTGLVCDDLSSFLSLNHTQSLRDAWRV